MTTIEDRLRVLKVLGGLARDLEQDSGPARDAGRPNPPHRPRGDRGPWPPHPAAAPPAPL